MGAGTFKKFVLFLERVKFKYGKKFFPNFQKNYEKYIDLRTKRALEKAKTAEERKGVLDDYKKYQDEKNKKKNLHTLQIRHFLSNLILWYAFMECDCYDILEFYYTDVTIK